MKTGTELLKIVKDYVTLYIFDNIEDYFYGYMVPSSGYLKLFAVEADNGGIVLILPKKENPNVLPDVPIPKALQYFHRVRQNGLTYWSGRRRKA